MTSSSYIAASKDPATPVVADVEKGSSSSASSSAAQLDEAYHLHRAYEHTAVSASEEARVLRRLDKRILPVLFFVYMLQYLDKNALNFSSAFGLEDALALKKGEFSWLGSVFYFGYLVSQYPASWAMQRLPTAKFLGVSVLGWGVVLITTPACKNFAGIMANRFLLGLFEGPVNPGFVLIIGTFYKAAEQPLRLETYYCTNGLATMFGGLIGYAVGHIKSHLPQWMYVFLIFGAASLVCGIATLVFLPDSPSTAGFLNEHERGVAVKRVVGNHQGVKNRHFKAYQAVQAARDPKTWMLVIGAIGAQIPNAALTTFGSLILKSFGFNTLETQYMQIPGGFVQFVGLISGGFICSRYPNVRCLTMTVANLLCITGAAMLVGLPDSARWPRLVGLWLCYFQGLGFSMSLTMVSTNIAGYTKKQVTGAALFVGYCIGNIIGPQTFKNGSAKSGYRTAYVAMLIGYSVKFLAMICLWIYMHFQNTKRDREAAEADGLESALAEAEAREEGMKDRTELENKGFRYTL
ncbi:MFS transporter [Geopyxis carbonaria]|nr:MFS transporter [Geopyxis carbonaria]